MCLVVFPWMSSSPPWIPSEPGALYGKTSLLSDTMPAHDILSGESQSIKFVSQMTLSSLLTQSRQHPREVLWDKWLVSAGKLRVTLHCTWRCQLPLAPGFLSCLLWGCEGDAHWKKKYLQSSGTEAKIVSFVITNNEIMMRGTLLFEGAYAWTGRNGDY